MWWYTDPSGARRGPFDTAAMRGWLQQGWFDGSLMVARVGSGHDYHPLSGYPDFAAAAAAAAAAANSSAEVPAATPDAATDPDATSGAADRRVVVNRGRKARSADDGEAPPASKRSKKQRRRALHNAIKQKPPDFHTRHDPAYGPTLAQCYPTFAKQARAMVAEDVHRAYHGALVTLLEAGCFTQQVVSLGTDNKWVSLRFTRLLIGKEGMTYQYNGVRCFAHPWEPHTPLADPGLDYRYSHKVRAALDRIHDMNTMLQGQAQRLCAERGVATDPGTNTFNITVTNLMQRTGPTVPEPYYGMGPQSVGWHRDQRLHPASTIGVYSCHAAIDSDRAVAPAVADSAATDSAAADSAAAPAVAAPAPATEAETALPAPHPAPATATPAAGGGDDMAADSDELLWKIGLKVAWDIVVPGVAVEIEDGDSYFMLGDCNTVNQHCVLSGSASRFSSTHRNGLTEGMTWTGIHDAYAAALNVADADDDDDAMAWAVRNAQLHTGVEEQWIRQFWVRSWTAVCAKSPVTERRL